MALTVLGLSGAVSHDPSAALYIDGKLVAAVEEERFVRDKHAKNRMPYESAKFCLEQAGIEPADVDVVAIPFAPISIMEKARWHYAKRYAYAPDRALDAILLGNRRYKRYYKRIEWCLQQLGFDLKKIKIQPVEHHLAHASSAYHCSGFKEKTAILGIDGKGYYFSPKLIEWLGPKREGDIADDPYIHYAASIQALFEKLALEMMDYYLGDIIRETGKVAFAGGCALNVKLNQKIISRPEVKELFVQPAASDAGTAVGAAAYVSHQRGVPVEKMEHVYLGPEYSNEDVIAACARHEARPQWQKIHNRSRRIGRILADGNPVAWFQGRMEFGPRALGGRSILGCPSVPGVADRINAQIKFRERWRPFCPSMLDTVGPQMFKIDHPAPFMTFTFEVNEEWKERVPEVVHEDGTSRAQVLKREYNPRYYDLMKELENLTGNGVALNTSLNRRGEPMICSPTDALNMFFGSDLQYLIMEDILVVKEGVDWYDSVG